LAKQEIKSIKSAASDEKKMLKSNYEVSIRSLKSEKNKLSGQVRRLEVKGQAGKGVGTGIDESIEIFARKLELKQIAEENRYSMKARQVELKKEREKENRRRKSSELHSQIAISEGGRFGYRVPYGSSTIGGRERDENYTMSTSNTTYNSGENRTNRVLRGAGEESTFGE